MGAAIGVQDSFDWKGVGLAALSGGISGGLSASGAFQGLPGGAAVQGAARAATANVLTQGVATAAGLQHRFDWTGVAVAGVVGGVGARLEMAGVTSPAASAFASGLTGAAARSLLTGSSFGDNLLSVLPDVIGNTIGNMVAGGVQAASSSSKPAVGGVTKSMLMERLASTGGSGHESLSALLKQAGGLASPGLIEAVLADPDIAAAAQAAMNASTLAEAELALNSTSGVIPMHRQSDGSYAFADSSRSVDVLSNGVLAPTGETASFVVTRAHAGDLRYVDAAFNDIDGQGMDLIIRAMFTDSGDSLGAHLAFSGASISLGDGTLINYGMTANQRLAWERANPIPVEVYAYQEAARRPNNLDREAGYTPQAPAPTYWASISVGYRNSGAPGRVTIYSTSPMTVSYGGGYVNVDQGGRMTSRAITPGAAYDLPDGSGYIRVESAGRAFVRHATELSDQDPIMQAWGVAATVFSSMLVPGSRAATVGPNGARVGAAAAKRSLLVPDEILTAPGSLGAARTWTIKSRLNANSLPTSGRIRFVPERGYDPNVPLPRGPNSGFLDRFGNEWLKGPSRTQGQPFEWDVQLSRTGRNELGWASRDGSHVNVSLDGHLTHR